MAILKPFKGLRPPKEIAHLVAARPYDVLNSNEAREEARGNPYSLLHITKPEIDLPMGTDEHAPEVYQKASENFRMFRQKDWLVPDERDLLYIYAQTMDGRTPVSYTHLRAHETPEHLVCRLLLEKKKK